MDRIELPLIAEVDQVLDDPEPQLAGLRRGPDDDDPRRVEDRAQGVVDILLQGLARRRIETPERRRFDRAFVGQHHVGVHGDGAGPGKDNRVDVQLSDAFLEQQTLRTADSRQDRH